ARARVDSQVAAAELTREEPARPGDAAAQVEHRDARSDAGAPCERANLAGAHEALLLDVVARLVGRLARAPQRLDERTALVLPHEAVTNRTTTRAVVRFGWSTAEHCCGPRRGRWPEPPPSSCCSRRSRTPSGSEAPAGSWGEHRGSCSTRRSRVRFGGTQPRGSARPDG